MHSYLIIAVVVVFPCVPDIAAPGAQISAGFCRRALSNCLLT